MLDFKISVVSTNISKEKTARGYLMATTKLAVHWDESWDGEDMGVVFFRHLTINSELRVIRMIQ